MRKPALLFFLLLATVLMSACLFGATGFLKKDGTYVYATSDERYSYVEHPIPDIDPQSFQIFSPLGYARDKLHAYFEYYPLQSADAGSFTALSDYYARDNAHVYFWADVIPGAIPASFTVLNFQYGKDDREVYYHTEPLKACDATTFVLLQDAWARDSQCVYSWDKKLPNAAPASFVVLNSEYGKDTNNAYTILGDIIPGADAATFKITTGKCAGCAQDKNRCYAYGKPVDCMTIK